MKRMRKREWIVFFGPGGKELLAITKAGSFEGEIAATIGLLAYERGIPEGSISFAEVTR